ncbi:MAG: HDOD domain-containing protein [Candidatus Zixiibacteriota bacterium]
MTTAVSDPALIRRLHQAQSLPTPPLVLSQLNRVLNDPAASAYDIAAVVAEDPGLATMVLRIANSAYYGLPKPTASVRQAIVILGMAVVRTLVLSASMAEVFARCQDEPEMQDQFWRHSLATASAARVLCGTHADGWAVTQSEEAFTAGLLHDIGKMILICHMPEERRRIRTHPDYGHLTDRQVEAAVLGWDHAAIGALLAERWRLPWVLASAIAHHHDLAVDGAEETRLAHAIHVADYLAHRLGDSDHRPSPAPDLDWHVASAFGIDRVNIDEFVERARLEYGRAGTFLQLVRGH